MISWISWVNFVHLCLHADLAWTPAASEWQPSMPVDDGKFDQLRLEKNSRKIEHLMFIYLFDVFFFKSPLGHVHPWSSAQRLDEANLDDYPMTFTRCPISRGAPILGCPNGKFEAFPTPNEQRVAVSSIFDFPVLTALAKPSPGQWNFTQAHDSRYILHTYCANSYAYCYFNHICAIIFWDAHSGHKKHLGSK